MQGFYTVYSKVFSDLTDEEVRAREFISSDDDDQSSTASSSDEQDQKNGGVPRTRKSTVYPKFGCSTDTYAETVAVFYQFWESFRTRKSYSWVEKYDTRVADSRAVSLTTKVVFSFCYTT